MFVEIHNLKPEQMEQQPCISIGSYRLQKYKSSHKCTVNEVRISTYYFKSGVYNDVEVQMRR